MQPDVPLPASTARPNWMLLVIALPISVLIAQLTGGSHALTDSLLMLMGWLDSPTLLQRYLAGWVSTLVVPTLLVFWVLKATRLGAWLALNRLTLACLLVADAVVVCLALSSLYMASMNERPFVSGTLTTVATPVVVAGIAIGFASLIGCTAWYRLVSDKSKASAWCSSQLREL